MMKHFPSNNVHLVDYVNFAAFPLKGAVAAWWTGYKGNRANEVITWDDFLRDFHAYHILQGLLERTHEEFMNLKQGHMSVNQYNLEYIKLARYAAEEVNSEE